MEPMDQNNSPRSKPKRMFRTQQPQSSSSGSDEELALEIEKLQSRSKPTRGLFQSTSAKAKKMESKHSSSSDDEFGSDRQKGSVYGHSYKSTRSGKSVAPVDMGATSIVEIDTQHDRDAQAIRDRALKSQRAGRSADDNVGYPFYMGHDHSEDGSKQRYGPQRAPQNIRSTVRWDYAPDICKDYKETGTCGFGDSCKFLHDRSDFKFGWQLDAEYEQGLYGDEECGPFEIDDSGPTTEEFPDTCNVCREPFRDPVKAECEHYFCENCFKNSVAKKKKCPICAVTVTGYARVAKDLILSLQNKSPPEIAVS